MKVYIMLLFIISICFIFTGFFYLLRLLLLIHSGGGAKPKIFTYRDIEIATKKFSDVIGEGRFGRVYRGKLERTGQVVFCYQDILDHFLL